jgi:hypothetical protein
VIALEVSLGAHRAWQNSLNGLNVGNFPGRNEKSAIHSHEISQPPNALGRSGRGHRHRQPALHVSHIGNSGRLPNFRRKYPFGRSCLNSQNAKVSSAKASVLSKV